MYFINTVWGKLYWADTIISNNIRFNDFKYGADTNFVYDYIRYINKMYVVGKNVYNVMAVENSMSVRKVNDSWYIMRELYENGSRLIIDKDRSSRFLLLNRSLKQTLILQSRFQYDDFHKTCEEIRRYLYDNQISLNDLKMDSYQKFVVYGIIKERDFRLYFSFKLRRFAKIVLKKG